MTESHVVARAITIAKDVARHGRRVRQVAELNQLKAGALRATVDTVTEKGIDSIESQCNDLMATFSARAASLTARQKKYKQRSLDSSLAPSTRRAWYVQMRLVDELLQSIRDEAVSTFLHLNELLIVVRANSSGTTADLPKPLVFPDSLSIAPTLPDVATLYTLEKRSINIENAQNIYYSSERTEKEFVPEKTSTAQAYTQFFTAVGIQDESLRNLVAGVVKAAVEGDKALLSQVQAALDTIQPHAPVGLPAQAPELYRDRPLHAETGERENIEQFLTRVYEKEIEARLLTEPALSRLDKTAYNVLRETKAFFPGLKIPSKQELMAQDKPDAAALRAVQRQAKRSYRERLAARSGDEGPLIEK